MPVPYKRARRSDPVIYSDSDKEGTHGDKNGFQFHTKQEPAGDWDEIIPRENSGLLECEKCDVRFLEAEALHRHKLRGDNEAGVRKHFYCGMCRIDFKDESALKSHVMESSEHAICRKRSHEFNAFEALGLHSKQVYWPKSATTHPCLGCNALFSSISAVTQHIESRQCHGKVSASDFRNLVNREKNPISKNDLQVDILAGATTTQSWRASIIPPRVKAALAHTPEGFEAEKPVTKDFVSVSDQILPAKPVGYRIENLAEFWNETLGVYVCPLLKCQKKFCSSTALQAHLESITHDKKSFRCPTCFSCFASSSALLQHAESEACEVKKSPAYQELIKGGTSGLVDQDKKTEYKTCWRK